MATPLKSQRLQAGLNTPLQKLGELPPQIFLSCLEGVPVGLRDVLVEKWSSQLRVKVQSPRKNASLH